MRGWELGAHTHTAALAALQELLEVSLSAPGRVTLPRAPPHTLLLSGSLFSPFPKVQYSLVLFSLNSTACSLNMADASARH